ncbi:NADH dehydrogenase [ubiquinone] 1 beta subcomplex subunit 5, mitochondrial-like [Bicyclus anynana]|uniref:NADH dehydrogenase [ubiquinone] 1 beta subcomplex subunit 5, mitochondrial n=1 Tax=Bicyclus anynana TaxID=110368 RepID=T1TCU1_BICAN|nr:NADH dehydrogenase [ubiquinone] 1 beta subcomplex subunit 5, mitochondrial-like [Bicyclus anynana]AGT62473.1 Z-lethal(3)neo18 [Bicyclus anynana]
MMPWTACRYFIEKTLLINRKQVTCITQHVKFSISEPLRGGDQRIFRLTPSRFQWHKFKDMFHLYAMVGLIPVGAIIFYSNVYIGPAQLTVTPPNYCPKHWEYHRHPISRFIARYIHNSPQQEYEKFLHFIDEEKQKAKLRALEKQVLSKMAERHDYKSYYYRPVYNKYIRINKKIGDSLIMEMGDDHDGDQD